MRRNITFFYLEWPEEIVSVSMVPNQVMGEMVLDGSGQFIPAGIDGFRTLSLLSASLVAHDRATEDTHTHHTQKESLIRTSD